MKNEHCAHLWQTNRVAVLRALRHLAFAACIGGCASIGAERQAEQAAAHARALALEGCYDCLLEARAILERSPRTATSARGGELRFEIELLVALREKELGLDASDAMARARGLTASLPAGSDTGTFLMLVDAIPPDEAALPSQDRRKHLVEHRNVRRERSRWLAWLKTGPLSPHFRQYVSLALSCAYPGDAPGPPDEAEWPVAGDAPPLLQYRAAVCGKADTAALLDLRQRVPAFVETAFALARRELRMVHAGGSVRAMPYLDDVHRRFPLSPSVTYLSGMVRQVHGNCRDALPFFEQTTTLRPTHDRALLATIICASHLGRHQEAIDDASRLIELGGSNAGDAYYWRAWNRHRRHELSDAARDVERARTLLYNEAVLTLAGVIAHDADRLDDAERHLTSARAGPGNRNCQAMWYLGLVNFRREQWSASAREFADATACYETQAGETEALLDDVQHRVDLPPAFRDSQLAGLRAELAENRAQSSAAAYNAALNFVRGRDFANAATYIDRAARDPARAPGLDELRRLVKSPQD